MATSEFDDEGAATRTALFKVTEVYLCDDISVFHRDELAEEPNSSSTSGNANSSFRSPANEYTSVEDLESAQEMTALGLPVAFSSNKEKRDSITRGKIKEAHAKFLFSDEVNENRVSIPTEAVESKREASPRVLCDRESINKCILPESQHEFFYLDSEEHGIAVVHSDGELKRVITAVHDEVEKRQGTDLTVISNTDKELGPDCFELQRNMETAKHHISSDAGSFHEMITRETSLEYLHERECSNEEDEDGCLQVSSTSCERTCVENYGPDSSTLKPCSTSPSSHLDFCKDKDYHDNSICFEYGDWKVAWDALYMRYYFYNCQTQESTWNLPAGWENLGMSGSTASSNEMIAYATEADTNIGYGCDTIQTQEASVDRTDELQKSICDIMCLSGPSEKVLSKPSETPVVSLCESDQLTANCGCISSVKQDDDDKNCDEQDELGLSGGSGGHGEVQTAHEYLVQIPNNNSLITNQEMDLKEYEKNGSPETCITTMSKRGSRRRIQNSNGKKKRHHPKRLTVQAIPRFVSSEMLKYWCQRYSLFSQFDDGIKMDEEGWFSVTPESIAKHHAYRCGTGTIIDCFAGVGGNTIQFAMRSIHVLAIEIDSPRLSYAQHNAVIYGVGDRIDFINADFFQIAHHLKGDVVFLSPPWGGPDYAKMQTYNIETMLKPHKGSSLFHVAKTIAPKVVMFLPRNVDISQLAELSLSDTSPWSLEVEKNFLNGQLKAITAYFEKMVP